jgi:hypothetical protein
LQADALHGSEPNRTIRVFKAFPHLREIYFVIICHPRKLLGGKIANLNALIGQRLGYGRLGGWANRDQTAHSDEGVFLVIQKFGQFGDGWCGICIQSFESGDAELLPILRRTPMQKINSQLFALADEPGADGVFLCFN